MESEDEHWIISAFPGSAGAEKVDEWVGDILFAEDDEGVPHMQRGVQDRDADDGDVCISPMFLISNVGSEEQILVVRQPALELEGSKWLSPRRLLSCNMDLVHEAARCTFRIEGSVLWQQSISVPGTAFVVAPMSIASALHMRYDEAGRQLNMWRVAQAYPMPLDMFGHPQLRRMHLKLGGEESWDFPSGLLMHDPLSAEPYAWQSQEKYLSACDIGFWDKEERKRFEAPSKPNLLHELQDFWLPFSLKEEILHRPELEKTPACAMVSYPAFSSLKQKMGSKDNCAQKDLFNEYRSLFQSEINKKVEEKAKEHNVSPKDIETGPAFREFRTTLSLEIFFKLKDVLSRTFGSFNDGDCVCSIGRVLALNETMVATSLSSLPGSSGAALFLLGLPVDKMFFAVHNAPSVSKGDYNIATHVDNPSFVLGYFKHVIHKLPLPSSSYWKTHDLRYKLFIRWLILHVDLLINEKASIVGEKQAWSREQRAWLEAANDSCREKLVF